jgi:hypothetical protein
VANPRDRFEPNAKIHSPQAAQSHWVNEEVTYWLGTLRRAEPSVGPTRLGSECVDFFLVEHLRARAWTASDPVAIRSSAAADSSTSASGPAMVTVPPRPSSYWAQPLPMPVPPPVMSTVRPSNVVMGFSSSLRGFGTGVTPSPLAMFLVRRRLTDPRTSPRPYCDPSRGDHRIALAAARLCFRYRDRVLHGTVTGPLGPRNYTRGLYALLIRSR